MQLRRRWGFRRPSWLRLPKMPVIDTQSPGFKGWVTRIWVAVVVVLVAGSCWYGRKAYVGYRQQQQSLPTQQAAAPEEVQTAEAPPEIKVPIPRLNLNDLDSVIAHNEAIKLAQVARGQEVVDLDQQVADQSTGSGEQEATDINEAAIDLDEQAVNVPKPGATEDGKSEGGKETGDSSQKRPWGWVVFLVIVALVAIIVLVVRSRNLSQHRPHFDAEGRPIISLGEFEDRPQRSMPNWLRSLLGGIIGFLAFNLLACLFVWQGKISLVAGLIGAGAVVWILNTNSAQRRQHIGEIVSAVDAIGEIRQERRQRRHVRRNGGDDQPPITPGDNSGGDT